MSTPRLTNISNLMYNRQYDLIRRQKSSNIGLNIIALGIIGLLIYTLIQRHNEKEIANNKKIKKI